jgi:hypothetical protein
MRDSSLGRRHIDADDLVAWSIDRRRNFRVTPFTANGGALPSVKRARFKEYHEQAPQAEPGAARPPDGIPSRYAAIRPVCATAAKRDDELASLQGAIGKARNSVPSGVERDLL